MRPHEIFAKVGKVIQSAGRVGAGLRDTFTAPTSVPTIVDAGPGAAVTVQPGELEADEARRRARTRDRGPARQRTAVPHVDDPHDFDEGAFQQWYGERSRAATPPLAPDPDDPLHYYDYRAAYRARAEPDEQGHWPSDYKRVGHPELIVDGLDTRTQTPADPGLEAMGVTARLLASTEKPTGRERRLRAGEVFARAARGPVDVPSRSDFVAEQMQRLSEDSEFRERFGDRAAETAAAMGGPEVDVRGATREILARPVTGSVLRAAEHMAGTVARGVGRLAEAAGMERVAGSLRDFARSQEELVDEAREERVRRTAETFRLSPAWASKVTTVGDWLSSGVVTSAGIIATGPTLATPAMFALGLGEIDQEAEAVGLTPDERNILKEAAVATVYAQIERLGELPASPAVRRLVGRYADLLPQGLEADILSGRPIRTIMAKFGLTEMAEEAAQELATMGVIAQEGEGRQYTPEEVLQRAALAAAGGAVGSLPFGVGAGLAARAVRQQLDAATATADADQRPAAETPTARGSSLFLQRVRQRAAEFLDPRGARERRDAQRALEVDDQTGIGSRRAFDAAKATAESDPDVAFVVFDLNNLKAANDNLGHESGDAFIAQAAQAIHQAAEQTTMPGRTFRTGGDEFVALVPADRADAVRDAAERAFGAHDAGGFRVSLTGAAGSTFDEADRAVQPRKAEAREAYRPGSVAGTESPAGELAGPGQLPAYYVDPQDIDVEPARFQFKESVDPRTGETGVLRDVTTWKHESAGIVQVWRDPADGRLRVVNGHQRIAKARQLGVGQVLALEIQAPSAEVARTIGALTNIGEGSGTAVDAAKVIRQQGLTPEELRAQGVPLTGDVARDGLALANLHEGLFELVARGKQPVKRMAVIGRSGLAPEQQLALWQLVQKQKGAERLTNAEIEEFARFVRSAGTERVTQETLFGTETLDESLALDKARLSAWTKEQLRKQARLFKFVSRGERAEQIAEAGVGSIDAEAAGALGTEASQVAEVYERLSGSTGPVSEALNTAARAIRQGENENAVRARLLEDVRAAVQAVVEGRTGERRSAGSEIPRGASGTREEGSPLEAEGPASNRVTPPRDADLFGEPVGREEGQGELLSTGGPQGVSAAIEEAQATVSRLQGRVDRGSATEDELRRYQEARALLRRSEGMDAEDLARRREGAPESPQDLSTGDLFEAARGAPDLGSRGTEPGAGRFMARSVRAVWPEATDADVGAVEETMRTLVPGNDLNLGSLSREQFDTIMRAAIERVRGPVEDAESVVVEPHALPAPQGPPAEESRPAPSVAMTAPGVSPELRDEFINLVRSIGDDEIGQRARQWTSTVAIRDYARARETGASPDDALRSVLHHLDPDFQAAFRSILGDPTVLEERIRTGREAGERAFASGAQRTPPEGVHKNAWLRGWDLAQRDAQLAAPSEAPADELAPSPGELPVATTPAVLMKTGEAYTGETPQAALERAQLVHGKKGESFAAFMAKVEDPTALQGADGRLIRSTTQEDAEAASEEDLPTLEELRAERERILAEARAQGIIPPDPAEAAARDADFWDWGPQPTRPHDDATARYAWHVNTADTLERLTAIQERLEQEPAAEMPKKERKSLLSRIDERRAGLGGQGGVAPLRDAPSESPLGGAEALPADVTVAGETRTLRPIAPVELVRLAGELLKGDRVFVRKFPRSRGVFYPDPLDPRIGLDPSLGKDYDQFARTLAHEIGHLVDFLEEKTMSRGNILGRIASLRSYLLESITALPTDSQRALTPTDRSRIRRAAEKRVGPRPKPSEKAALETWRGEVRTIYAELILEEMEVRHMLGRERVHEELLLLSEWWRPFDRATASDAHIRYRESSPELYADALSVLLNSPGSLQARAPQFFDAWLAYLDEKPSVRSTYEEIQDLLAGGETAVYEARRAELEADFTRGEEIQRTAEERQHPQSFVSYLKQLLVSRAAPVTAAERKRLRRQGRRLSAHSAEHAVKMAMQEFQHGDNVNRLMLMDIERDVQKPIREAGVTEDDAGMYLMLQRVAEGDRGGLAEQAREAIMELTGQSSWSAAKAAYVAAGTAQSEGAEDAPDHFEFDAALLELAETGTLNPRGYTPKEARRQLEGLREELGEDGYRALEGSMRRLREILFRSVEEAVRVGSYSQEIYKTRTLPNRETYAPFAVLHYFSGRVPAAIRRQIGTVSGIANPYTVAIMKAMTLNRLNELQKAKRAILDVLDRDFPGQGPEQRIDQFHREKHAGPGRENLMYLVDGKPHYREVDTYIARVLESSDLGATERLVKALSSRAYGLFHPLYVSWSLAWQARNIQRDWKRTYKNLAAAHAGKPSYRQAIESVLDLGRLAKAYGKTASAAWRHARRRDDRVIRQMLKDRALGRAFHSFEPVESDLTHERLLQRYGIMKPEHESVRGAARAVGHPIEVMGVFQETWSKAAAFKLLGEQGLEGQERAYIVRNYTGTPDSTERGLGSDATNTLFMYANVIVAGLRADAEVATQPSTASGYWLRAMMIDFTPKMLMAAALAGWLGDELKEWYERIPSYDLEKYLIVPVPPFWSTNERGDRKSVYLRVPHDDANRILAASTWALLMGNRPYAPSHALGILSGEFPGLTPALDLPIKWGQALAGRNPYDAWLGRNVVPRTEWEAGGWPRQKEMLRYTLGQFGIVSQVLGRWTYAPPEPSEAAPGETLLRSIPGLSTLVKVSDAGLDENRYWEIDSEAQRRARLRADLSRPVRRAVSERSRLNRWGDDRLSTTERTRRRQLNTWYRSRYLPLTADLEAARDAGDKDAYRAALGRLNESLTSPPTASPARGPSRPARPSRPTRAARPRR